MPSEYVCSLPSLVLIAQAISFLERRQRKRQTDKQTDAHAGGYTAGVAKYH